MRTFISFIMIFGTTLSSWAQDKAAENLLAYFSGSCKTNAQWTQSAIADSNAIIRTLTAMADDPDCAGATGAIAQLNNLSSQLATLEKLNDTKNAVSSYNAEEQELMIQLTKTSDPNAISEINASLRFLQVERAKLLSSDKTAEKLSGEDKVTVLGQIAQSANSSFQQITSNQRCLDKNPNLLQSATSIMAGVGSAATILNPAIGLSMTAGSTFAKVAMDGIRNTRYARTIRRISDSTITFEAYSCALESMSERWCQMKDAESFLDFKAKHRRRAIKDPGLAEAIALNDREIPALLDWLNKVRNGVAPRTTADAERRNVVLTRELIVRSRADYGQSLIEQNRKTYDSLEGKPDDQQWLYLRSIIMSLAPQGSMSSNGIKDPLNDIYAQMYSPYYLLGLKEDDSRIRSMDGIQDFGSWNKPPELIVTLDSVKVKFLEWTDRAANLVNRELTEVQQPDPLQTLSSANIESEPWMVTPLDSFLKVAEFLENNPPGEKQGDFTKIYQDTLKKLKEIHDTIVYAIATGDVSRLENSELTPIESIYEIAQLKYGIVVLQARLEMIVRLSLLEYIKNSPEEDQILIAQLLASDRFFESISTMSGTSSYAILKEDIRRGKAYTMINLANFMDIFGHNINRSLQKLYFDEKNSGSTVGRAYRDLRTSMCFLILGAENAEKWINTSYCEGLKLESMEPGGPESITLTKDTFTQDLSHRACTFREYFRQSDIYQKWGIKQSVRNVNF